VSPRPRPAPPAAHFDRPAEVAAHIATHSAVVVSGPDSDRSAAYAVAIARAASVSRRVAIGDLVGEAAPIYALAGGEDAPGITDCFREGLALTEVARPVEEVPSLFVLPSGARVRTDESLASPERWGRLVRGFAEAGGLLILVAPDHSHLLPILGQAGAVLLHTGAGDAAPEGIPLVATIGAALPPPRSRAGRAGGIAGWQLAAAAIGALVIGGIGAVTWTMAANRPDGAVVVAPTLRAEIAVDSTARETGARTMEIVERASAADRQRAVPFAIQLVAANTASNANSLLADAARDAALPASTVSVISLRSGTGGGRTAQWHKVIVGAWREAGSADSALAELRRNGVVRAGEGAVVRAPYGVLLADSASPERARAVMDVWRAKGVTPYALRQDEGTMRVYAGAFETVAQAITMTALVQAAGGAPVVAYRTGRPD
jgi:hypothetical protein